MSTDWTKNSTRTPNKIAFDKELFASIPQVMISDAPKAFVTLVGNAEGLLDHINQAKGLGYNETEIIVVENQKKVYEALEREKLALGVKCLIEFDDIVNVVEKLPRNTILGWDFDGCAPISTEWFSILKLYASFENPHFFNITADPRLGRRPSDYKCIGEILHLPKVRRQVYFNDVDPKDGKFKVQKTMDAYPSDNKCFHLLGRHCGIEFETRCYDSKPTSGKSKMKYKKMMSYCAVGKC